MPVTGGDDSPGSFRELRWGALVVGAVAHLVPQDAVGLAGVAPVGMHVTAVAAGDVNKDGFTDFVFGRSGAAVLAASNGKGGFTLAEVSVLQGVTAALVSAALTLLLVSVRTRA